MNLKLNVIGLGHPTRWHVSINDDFATKEEAEQLKVDIELAMRIMENTPIIFAEDLDKEPTEEDIKSAKEADKYFREHEPVSFDSKTKLFQHLKALERAGYITPEWNETRDWQGNQTGAYKVFKVNSNAVKKK